MQVKPKNIVLKNGLEILLKSPIVNDSENLLQHLKKSYAYSYKNMNNPKNHWDNFAIEEENKILANFETSTSKFMICAFYNNTIVGNIVCAALLPEFQKHNGRIGMMAQADFCGIGLGTAMLEYAIIQAKEMELHRLELNVRTFNKAGIALYEGLGFKKIGLLQHAAFIEGEYFDEYMYELLL